MWILIGLLGLIYVGWCTLLYFLQDGLLFPGAFMGPDSQQPFDPNTEVITRQLDEGGTVEAWVIPPPKTRGATTGRANPVVFYFHGNGEINAYQDRMVQPYHELGFTVVLVEYRGYGGSAGHPTQRGIVEDAEHFLKQVVNRPDVDPRGVVYHGRSLGGGVAAQLALRRKPAAMILESTFKNITSMTWQYGAPPMLVANPFRTDKALKQLDVPVLLFHGSEDKSIPPSHSKRLNEIASNSKRITYPVGHNDFPGPENEEAYWKAIARFLQGLGVADP